MKTYSDIKQKSASKASQNNPLQQGVSVKNPLQLMPSRQNPLQPIVSNQNPLQLYRRSEGVQPGAYPARTTYPAGPGQWQPDAGKQSGEEVVRESQPAVIQPKGHPARTSYPLPPVQKKPNNTGLPDKLKEGVENLSGFSMDDVKVHYNSNKPAQLQALAYAQGTDIHVGPGQEKHLPHEAWHVVQQKQGRVQPTLQMKGGVAVNVDKELEKEADLMGEKAFQIKTIGISDASNVIDALYKTVIQPRLGFEIEMHVLVDINGRPIPEKVDLGTAGVHNVELTVDHGPAVAAPTPTPAHRAIFSVPGMGPVLHGGGHAGLLLGPYDTPIGTETRLDFPGGVVAVDPRAAHPINLLNWANWSAATMAIDRGSIRNPDNRPVVRIDQILQQHNYQLLYDNYETPYAQSILGAIKAQINLWHTTNPNANLRLGRQTSNARRTARYNTTSLHINALDLEVGLHRTMWANNPAPPNNMTRYYRQPGGGIMGPWNHAHPLFAPQEGMGRDRYASILEIVTPGGLGFEPETPAGRINIIGAMTDAVNLAIAIENATGNFAHRVLLNTVATVNNVTNPQIYVGNTQQPDQTTDASIQSTMAIDLAQIASFIKSTVAAAMNPQQLFALKHNSDPVGQMGIPVPRRAETEMARAPLAARNIIRNHMAGVAGWNGNVTHLRGLITLICQYLMMGRHAHHGGQWGLDKNIVHLLSRNDLGSVIFAQLVPPAEQALVATLLLQAPLIAAILAETHRNGNMAVFNQAGDNIPPYIHPAPYDISCTDFIQNIFLGQPDGITGHLGGFRQFPHPEEADPTGARVGDYRRVGAANREGAIFELRNMIPSDALNLATDRFPHNQWIGIANYMCNLLAALNARTVAHSATDTRYRQATGVLHNESAPW